MTTSIPTLEKIQAALADDDRLVDAIVPLLWAEKFPIQAVNYWPHSGPSLAAADRVFAQAAATRGYKIVGSDRDEE